MEPCIFCQMVAGKVPLYPIWEDSAHLAFLSIFPNTEGVTVIIPKQHYPSDPFLLPDSVLTALIIATKQVAQRLVSAFTGDVARCGMIFEGFGVDHVHSKLIPMHGTANINSCSSIEQPKKKFFTRYEGYLSSHDCERADDVELAALAQKIRHTDPQN